jgi:tetratricopeptide (TPR) repeat protein
VGAAAGYLPVAQIGMTFLHPMADRYLYFALPGLIGGCAFAWRDAWRCRAPAAATTRRVATAAGALALAGIALMALRSHAQAQHWRSAATRALASAARYPDGLPAQLLEAQRTALRGDAPGTVRALRAAVAQGYDRFETLADGPVYDAVRRDPAFQQLLHEMATSWIEQSLKLEHATQADLLARAEAYAVLGDRTRAVTTLDEALRIGGPLDARARAERLRQSRPGR